MNKKAEVWILVFLLAISIGFWYLVSPSKEYALLKASTSGDTNLIATLVRDGAKINRRLGPHGRTALISAVSSGRDESVSVLLRLGADKGIRDESGKAAVDYAREAGKTNLMSLLEDR